MSLTQRGLSLLCQGTAVWVPWRLEETTGTLYTGEVVSEGVCTLVTSISVQSPAQTWPAVYKVVAVDKASVQSPVGTHLPVRKVPPERPLECTKSPPAFGQCTKSCRNDPSSAQSPTLYTGCPVRRGVCTLVLTSSVQSPVGTHLPVYKVPAVSSGHRAPPCVSGLMQARRRDKGPAARATQGTARGRPRRRL